MKARMSVLFMVLGMMTATAVSTSGQSRDLPVYEVSRTATPIKVDGKLDDAIWANAPRFRDFRLNLDGSPSPYKTEAKALYDGLLDIYLLDIRKPLHYESWNSQKLKWGVQVFGTVDGKNGDQEWTCEIALPLEDIVTAKNLPPQAGDRWRLNLYRMEKLPRPALLAWSPTFKDDFHLPGKFGEIVFTNHLVR